MYAKFFFLVGLAVFDVIYAAPGIISESAESAEVKYSFSYAVKDESSENDFGHQETREDDDTEGSYYIQLPDGRLQKVSYNVDGDDGYVAEVTYEEEAQFPSAESYESNESK